MTKKDTAFFYNYDYTKKWLNLDLKMAKRIGDEIEVDWDLVDLGEFLQGIKEEQEHSGILGGENTKVIEKYDYVGSDKIAYEHLLEVPNYYTMLEELEDKSDELYPSVEAKKAWVKLMRERHSAHWKSVAS